MYMSRGNKNAMTSNCFGFIIGFLVLLSFFFLSFASRGVSVSFPGNIIEFVELFLIDGSSKVHRIGRHWKGDLVKGTVTSLSSESFIFVTDCERKLFLFVDFSINLVV